MSCHSSQSLTDTQKDVTFFLLFPYVNSANCVLLCNTFTFTYGQTQKGLLEIHSFFIFMKNKQQKNNNHTLK